MKGQKRGSLSPALTRGRDRFQAWRRSREAGTRIPDRLWKLAVKLAAKHGISQTSTVLGLDYYSLKRHVDSAPPEISNGFVEFSSVLMPNRGECLVEFEDSAGARMRVHLKGYDAPDLGALGRGFWNGQ